MKKKKIWFVVGALFIFISAFFVYDIAVSYGEFSRDRENIRVIEARQRAINHESGRIQHDIDRFSKDPRAAEELLRRKYRMLRSDQYKYIPEK